MLFHVAEIYSFSLLFNIMLYEYAVIYLSFLIKKQYCFQFGQFHIILWSLNTMLWLLGSYVHIYVGHIRGGFQGHNMCIFWTLIDNNQAVYLK